jgi:type I restriction enzyme S subunit
MSQLVLPELPQSWTSVRVGDIAKIAYGKALRAKDRAGEGGVPVYGSGGIVGEHNVASHPGPSIIIGRKGTVGAVYLAKGPFWCIDTAFYLDDVNATVDLEFMAHMLRVIDLSRLSIVVGVPGIRRKDIEEEKIPLPPLPEQRRIVAMLGQADALRQLRRQADGRAQELLQALFCEMFGDPVTNPKNWETIKLEEVCHRITDGTHQSPPFEDRGIPFLFVSNIVDGKIAIPQKLL